MEDYELNWVAAKALSDYMDATEVDPGMVDSESLLVLAARTMLAYLVMIKGDRNAWLHAMERIGQYAHAEFEKTPAKASE